jgi:hypothetical protein
MQIDTILTWLKSRLTESSTWTWLTVLAGYVGYTIDPELLQYIAGVAVSIITLIQFIKKDPLTEGDTLQISVADVDDEEEPTEEEEEETKEEE